mmetsp:Transcript_30059/g.82119  ORF Transcript_30059/g.82119 Transcript_30059/m.82119 type:complete len:221 (+) Transcript_30059:2247-2909(+)|eukprot:scaffold32217_cov27-Tisochrysis_lutea.AAC.4
MGTHCPSRKQHSPPPLPEPPGAVSSPVPKWGRRANEGAADPVTNGGTALHDRAERRMSRCAFGTTVKRTCGAYPRRREASDSLRSSCCSAANGGLAQPGNTPGMSPEWLGSGLRVVAVVPGVLVSTTPCLLTERSPKVCAPREPSACTTWLPLNPSATGAPLCAHGALARPLAAEPVAHAHGAESTRSMNGGIGAGSNGGCEPGSGSAPSSGEAATGAEM